MDVTQKLLEQATSLNSEASDEENPSPKSPSSTHSHPQSSTPQRPTRWADYPEDFQDSQDPYELE